MHLYIYIYLNGALKIDVRKIFTRDRESAGPALTQLSFVYHYDMIRYDMIQFGTIRYDTIQ